MKKTITLIWLLFAYFVAFPITPEKKEKEKPIEISSNLSPGDLSLDNRFIYPAWGFYFEASPGLTNIKNNNLSSEIWDSKKGLGYTFNVGYFQSLGPWFKIKTGIGISSYNNTLNANGDLPTQTLSDIDNDTYTETLTLTNVEKTTNPMYLSVPLIFEFGNPNIERIGFYADLGLKYSFLLNESYTSSGTYSTKGRYEQWEVTLENVPELGFYNNKNLATNAALKNSNISIVAGAGIFVPLSTVVIFKGGVVTNFGVADIGNNKTENTNSNVINNQVHEYRSPYIDNSLAVVKGSRTFHLGLEFGLYISHRLK
ncbi:porin family protein [Maribellus maritimus]|uniref:outer membrane beta-barrel protein n=1 Tax=Maribellus maritimus TaxID=2870838 RepID=UPI001EEC3775|nr:outer membrane beta-barrel protein [Maribellus maritimus]MCG6187528.1 PorT family protein [Maribellus maritimus]